MKKFAIENQLVFGCVLRSGGDYYPDHVLRLKRMVNKSFETLPRFICLSDQWQVLRRMNIEAYPLQYNWPGWWSVIELFLLKGSILVTGLDTILIRDMDSLGNVALKAKENEFYMMRAFRPWVRNYISGFIAWNGDFSFIVEEFKNNYEKITSSYRGEQDFTQSLIKKKKGYKVKPIDDEVKGGLYSYKWHIRQRGFIPTDTKAILFHGKPRPFDVRNEEIQRLYFNP